MVTLRERRPKPTPSPPPPSKKSNSLKKSTAAAAAARKHNKNSTQNQRLRRKCKPHFLLDETGDQVWITQATLQDIHDAQKRGKIPIEVRKRKQLVTVPSASVRQAIYQRAALALADLESKLLPTYGGRPWKCTVRVQEATQQHGSSRKKAHSSTPYFLWRPNGTLELAAWPHLVEKIPTPPNFPGFSKGNSSKRQAHQQQLHEEEEEEEISQALQVGEEEDEDVVELQEREPCELSRLAHQERFNTPLPTITMKWCSPLREIFNSRKAAWEHAVALCQQEVAIDKVIHGYGANGKPIKIYRPSKTAALKVGKWRFQRDGLWMVGQEEAWQRERLRREGILLEGEDEFEEEGKADTTTVKNTKKPEKGKEDGDNNTTKKRRLTGLCYYLKCHRKAHKQKRLAEQAEQSGPRPSAIMYVEEEALHNAGDASILNSTIAVSPVVGREVTNNHDDSCHVEQMSDCHPIKSDAKEHCDVTIEESESPIISHHAEKMSVELGFVDSSGMCQDNRATGTERRTLVQEAQVIWSASPPYSIPIVESTLNVVMEDSSEALPGTTKMGKHCPVPHQTPDRLTKPEIRGSAASTDAESADEAKETSGNQAEASGSKIVSEFDLNVASPEKSVIDVDRPVTTSRPVNTSFTLRDAERELREIWKKLSKDERLSWSKRAKAYEESLASELPVVNENNFSTVSFDSSAVHGSLTTRHKDIVTSSTVTPMKSSMVLDVSVPTGTVRYTVPECNVSVAIKDSQLKRVVSPDESEIRERDTNVEAGSISHPRALYPETGETVVPRPPGMKRFDFSSHWRLNEEQIRLCYDAGMEHFDQIMRTVRARDLLRELQDGFDLLRERGRGRYDMELPAFESPEFNFLTDIKRAPWMPIVREILGKEVVLIHKGMFLSLPGSEMQPYHQDGIHLTSQYQRPCHAINVFIPLVDLTASNGPTEFVLGSHILGHEDHDPDFIEIPKVPAGTPIIFDYRLGHRGLGNTSDFPRPIVYCTYAAAADGKEFRDSVNFSRKRYHRIGELVEKGLTREERANKRKQVLEDAALEKALAESKRLCRTEEVVGTEIARPV